MMKARCQAAPPDLLAPLLSHSQTGPLDSWDHFCNKDHLFSEMFILAGDLWCQHVDCNMAVLWYMDNSKWVALNLFDYM